MSICWHSKVFLYIDFIYIISRSKWQKKRKKSARLDESLLEYLLFLFWWLQSILEKAKWIIHQTQQHSKSRKLTQHKKESTESMKFSQKIQHSRKQKNLIQIQSESISHQHQVKILKQSHADKRWIFRKKSTALLLWKHLFDEKHRCSVFEQSEQSTSVQIIDKRKAPMWCFFHTKYFLS